MTLVCQNTAKYCIIKSLEILFRNCDYLPIDLQLKVVDILAQKGLNRKCIFCTTNDIEDEYHFILICPSYYNLRMRHVKRCYYRNPSKLKFIQLLNAAGKTLKNSAVYIYQRILRKEI